MRQTSFLALGISACLLLTAAPSFAAESLGAPSCQLAEQAKLPKVIFLGYNYQDQDSILTRVQVEKAAVEGKLFLASEVMRGGPFLPRFRATATEVLGGNLQTSKLYGIESDAPHAVYNSYRLQYDLLHAAAAPEVLLGLAVIAIYQSPLALSAYELVKERMLKGELHLPEALIQKIDQAIVEANPRTVGEDVLEIMDKNGLMAIDTEEFFIFNMAHHEALIKLANEKFQDKLLGRPLEAFTRAAQAEEIGFMTNAEVFLNSPVQQILQTVRDRDFADTISSLVCSNLQEQQILVLLGSDHVDSVQQRLETMSAGKMQFDAYETEYGGLDHKELLETLAGFEAPLAP